MKIKCNGQNKHVNEIGKKDVEKLLRPRIVLRGAPSSAPEIPPRLVVRCRHCAEGQVVLSREMIERVLAE